MIETLRDNDSIEYPYIDEEDCSHKSKSDFLQQTILGLCSCGNPNNTMIYIKDKLLEASDDKLWGNNQEQSFIFFKYWADNKGFLEHITSINCCWLSPLGKELINDINWCIENEINNELDN